MTAEEHAAVFMAAARKMSETADGIQEIDEGIQFRILGIMLGEIATAYGDYSLND